MGQIKNDRAIRMAGRLPMATSEIWKLIPESLIDRLAASDIAIVMQLLDKSYHNGRAITGAEVIDNSPTDGAVWVNAINASIEWREEGAEYERVEEHRPASLLGGPASTRIYNRKIKDGQLVATIKR